MRIKVITPTGDVILWDAEIRSIVKEKGRHVGLFVISKNNKHISHIDRMRKVEFYLKNGSTYEKVFVGVIEEIAPNGNKYEIGCNGLFFILQKRQKGTYGTKNAGQAIFDVLDDCNTDSDTGIIKGSNTSTADVSIEENGTAREIINNIGKFCEYDIDTHYKLNVADRLGEEKNINLLYSEVYGYQNSIKRYDFVKDSESIFNRIILRNSAGLESIVEDAESIEKYGLCETRTYTTLVDTQSDLDSLAYQILQLKKEGISDISIVARNKTIHNGITKGIDIFDISLGDTIGVSINSRDLVFSGRRRINKIKWVLNSNGHIDLELSFSSFGDRLDMEVSESTSQRLSRIEGEIF